MGTAACLGMHFVLTWSESALDAQGCRSLVQALRG
jgi:hypothetical protein